MANDTTAPTTNTIQKPKLALVTGASRGIGAAIAIRLAKEGFHVLINYASSEAKATQVREKIMAAGGMADLCPFDISNPTQVEEKFEFIKKTYGYLSVLVNNAGMTVDSLLIRMKDEDLDKIISVDLKGAIYCTRAAAKQMIRARDNCSIIQISSVIGESGNPGQSAYAAAKAGLIGFSKSAAKEVGSRQIRVNVVTPGFITTDMTEALTEEQKGAILQNVPLGFFGEPEDVASLVAFLARNESRYITGQVIGINGGMYM